MLLSVRQLQREHEAPAPGRPRAWLSPSRAPLQFAVRRLLAGPGKLRDHAVEVQVIGPEVERVSPRAVFDPADLERVRGVQEHTSFEQEQARVGGGPKHHAATSVYKVCGARLCGNYLYLGATRMPIANASARRFWPPPRERRVPRGMLCSSLFASHYFGHWCTEQLTAELMSRDLALPAYGTRLQRRYRHESAMREATGLHVEPSDHLFFDELWLTEDFGQNDSKRARYTRLRKRLRKGARPSSNRGVFVLRNGEVPERTLVNERALAEECVARGLELIDPERSSFARIRDALHDAPIVIGVEGSALVHAVMLMPASSTLLTLQPPNRFNNVLKDYTDCIGQRYAFTVGDPKGRGFELPSPRLWDLVERLARA